MQKLVFCFVFFYFTSYSQESFLENTIDSIINNDDYKNYHLVEKFVDSCIRTSRYDLAAQKGRFLIQNEIRKGNLNDAKLIVNNLLSYKSKFKTSKSTGHLLLKRGAINFFEEKLNLAANDYNLSADYFKKSGDSIFEADAIFFGAQVQANLGNFLKTVEKYNTAYNLYKALEDREYMYYSLAELTRVYSSNGFYTKAISNRKELINICTEEKNFILLGSLYFDTAMNFYDLADYKKQKEYLDISSKYLDSVSSSMFVNSKKTLFNIGLFKYYFSQKDYSKAKESFEKANDYRKKTYAPKYFENDILIAKGMISEKFGNLDAALKAYKKILKKGKNIANISFTIKALEGISNVYSKKNNFKESFNYLTKCNTLKDSINKNRYNNKLLYHQSLFEAEKKNVEIKLQKKDIEILKNKNRQKTQLLLYGGILIIITFWLVIALRDKKYALKSQKESERFSKNLIEFQENERSRLSRELHDGIGQAFLLIKNKINENQKDESIKLVNSAVEELRIISRDLTPFKLSELGLTSSIKNMIHNLNESSTIYFSDEIENIDGLYSKKSELNIYRIIQESLNNILKHSNAQGALINIKKLDSLLITIEDNGIGFNLKKTSNNINSYGLKILVERIKLLNGNISINSIISKGTNIMINLPINEDE